MRDVLRQVRIWTLLPLETKAVLIAVIPLAVLFCLSGTLCWLAQHERKSQRQIWESVELRKNLRSLFVVLWKADDLQHARPAERTTAPQVTATSLQAQTGELISNIESCLAVQPGAGWWSPIRRDLDEILSVLAQIESADARSFEEKEELSRRVSWDATMKRVRGNLEASIAEADGQVGPGLADLRNARRQFILVTSFIIVCCMAGGVPVMLLFMRWLLCRIGELEAGVVRLRGDSAIAPTAAKSDQIVRLARALMETEGELTKRNNRLKLALEGGQIHVWELDLSTRRMSFQENLDVSSAHAARKLPGSVDEWLEWVHPDDRLAVWVFFDHLLSDDGTWEVEHRLQLPGKETVWFTGRAQSGSKKGDDGGHIVGVLIDISDRKRDELLLLQSEETIRSQIRILRAVMASISDGVVVVGTDGSFMIVNPAAEAMLGLAAEEMTPSQWREQVGFFAHHGLDLPPAAEQPLTAALRGEEMNNVEIRVPNAGDNADDEEETWLSISGRPLIDSDGAVHGGVLVIADVSKRKREEKALRTAKTRAEEADQMKSRFVASISHDLRTPLNAIIGFSDLLSRQIPGPLNPKQQRFVQHVRNGSRHLLELINGLLDLSKIEAGQIDLVTENFPVREVVSEVLTIVGPLAADKKLEVENRITRDTTLCADRTRFLRLLYNLLTNAVKFTPERGRVWVEMSENGAEVEIRVSDTGIGIQAEDQAVIFDEFRQVGETAKKREGTGLGLTICKRLCERMGGRMWVKSEPGKGSTFGVVFSGGQASKAPEMAPVKKVAPGKVVILVVDEDPASREAASNLLATEGYDVVVARDLEEAMWKSRTHDPAGVLFGALRSRVDPWEGVRTMKKEAGLADTHFVGVSAEDQREQALAAGCSEHLTKPLDKRTLLRAFSYWVGRSEERPSRVLVYDDPANDLQHLAEVVRSEHCMAVAANQQEEALELLGTSQPEVVVSNLDAPGGRDLLNQVARHTGGRDLVRIGLTGGDCPENEEPSFADVRMLSRQKADWKDGLRAEIQRCVDWKRRRV
ncbi:MAG: ATP-binding protein [Bryobacteraceae bacterium]